MMDWSECQEKFIRRVEKDEFRKKSIIERALQRKKYIELQKIDEENVSFIIEGYYEVIKELLVAYLLQDGLRSKNHQCLFTYFYRKNQQYEGEVNLISQLSYYRNRLDYYGEAIPFSFYERNKEEIIKIIELLKRLLS